MKKLVIFPYNGNAVEALDCLGREFDFLGFIDDDVKKQGKQHDSTEVFSRNILDDNRDVYLLMVPGSSKSFLERRKIIEGFSQVRPEMMATVIHPRASVSSLARIGRNVLIMAGVTVTSNAAIGNHVCVLPNTVIHHDVSIGDYCLIGSNVSITGNVRIGINSYIGSGTSILCGVKIGDRAMIGMGSTVLQDIESDCTAVGNPCRIIKRNKRD